MANQTRTPKPKTNQGAAAAAHKVFGRKKQAHRREASEQFVVRPTPAVEGEEEGPLDEAAVLKRAVAYFQETRQVGVWGGKGGDGGVVKRVRWRRWMTTHQSGHPPTNHNNHHTTINTDR